MKFTIQIEGFSKGISSAVEVSSKGVDKDFYGVGRINLEAKNDSLVVSAFGGKLSISSILNPLLDDTLNYKPETEGKAVVSSKDLVGVLSSFDNTDQVTVELREENDTKEVKISLINDSEEFQTLPCLDHYVELPTKADSFAKEMKIRRDVLIDGVNKVFFASGFETTVQAFMVVAITANEDKVRFSAGTGNRFALYELEGKGIVDIGGITELVFVIPKEHIPALMKSLKVTSSEMVDLRTSKKDDGIYQIVVESSPSEFILLGADSNAKWTNEDKMLNKDYVTKATFRISDLDFAAKGTLATFNEQVKAEKKAHKAVIEVDLSKKVMNIKANEYMKSQRKVTLYDVASTDPAATAVTFSCVSPYLSEIVSIGDSNGFVQLEILEPKKPVVVYFNAGEKVADKKDIKNVNAAKDISEKFVMFFGTYAV